MASKSLGLLALSLLTFTGTVFRVGRAGARLQTGPLSECERISRALSQYRLMAAEDDGTLLPVPAEPVIPGDRYDGTPRLIRLLLLTRDLPAGAPLPGSGLYAGELVTAVRRFQARHGLEPDGCLGAATLAQLNTPLRVRVRQLELALECWRQLRYDPSHAAIILNLPEFRLRAYGPGGPAAHDPELEMKVVVGQAPDHKSPVLVSQLEEVIFRPYWTVPESIQENELLPEIRRDRSWLSANHFALIDPQTGLPAEEPPFEDMLAKLSTGEIALRQQPGPKNTLGLVKFMFPNPYDIYMHDTSARSLFSRERRDLSHGCIRVEKPLELAEWALAGQPEWSRDRIAAAVQGADNTSVKVERPISIVILYSTAAVMNNGEVHFFKDVYGEDGDLGEQLAAQGRE